MWCCDGETSIDQLSSKIFQVFGVAGYDEQGIVRGVLDSCEVLTVDVDGKSSDCGYMQVLLQFAPIVNFRNAKIWFLTQSSSGGARQAQSGSEKMVLSCFWLLHHGALRKA